MLTKVYVGLGGNIGETYQVFCKALHAIAILPGVYNLMVSRFYQATPVSSISQNRYLNAVCCFYTSSSAPELLVQLKEVEASLGKVPKSKESPRIIDLDILLFGIEVHNLPNLKIPHPLWQERLFVLMPLTDLETEIEIPDPKQPGQGYSLNLPQFIDRFPNRNNEVVMLWKE